MKKTFKNSWILSICLILTLILSSCGTANDTKNTDVKENTNSTSSGNFSQNEESEKVATSENSANETDKTDKGITDTEESITDLPEITKEPEVKLTAFEKLFADAPKLAWDDNRLAGFIDIKGNWVISPQFSDAKKFSEGLAAVKDAKNNLWGFIDTSGKYVIQPQYLDVTPVFEGTALVNSGKDGQYGNSWGMININGEYIIQPDYKYITYFKEGYAVIRSDSNSFRYVDAKGNIAFNGEVFLKAYLFHEGIAVVKAKDGRWKMLHLDGSISDFGVDLDPSGFDSCRLYGYGTSSEYIPLSEGWQAKTSYGYYTLIDKDGKPTGKQFDYKFYFNGDYACVDKGSSKTGFINRDYEWVVEPKYWDGGFIRSGIAWVVDEESLGNYKWYLIDMKGNIICDFEYHKGIRFNSGQMYSIYPDKPEFPVPAIKTTGDSPFDLKYGFADWNYEEVIPFIYEDAKGFSYDGSYAIVKYNGHYGIIDINGNWLIEPKFTSFDSKPIL